MTHSGYGRFIVRAVYGLHHCPGVSHGPVEGIVTGLTPAVEEGPVTCLQGEELPGGPLEPLSAQAILYRPIEPELGPTGRTCHIEDTGTVPCPQILPLAPGGRPEVGRPLEST